jgi:hypothetical protein
MYTYKPTYKPTYTTSSSIHREAAAVTGKVLEQVPPLLHYTYILLHFYDLAYGLTLCTINAKLLVKTLCTVIHSYEAPVPMRA